MKKYLMGGVCMALALGACAHHESHNHETEIESEAEAHEHAANEIVMTHEAIEAAGITTEVVQPGAFAEVLQTSGQILSAQGEEQTVVAPVAGTVQFTRQLTEGTALAAGKVVLTVESDQLMNGSQTERARIAYEAAKRDYDRSSRLVAKQIVTEKEFYAVKEKYETARLAYEAIAVSSGDKGTAVKAPIQGFVKTLAVGEGDFVEMGQPLMVLSKNRRLQLKAEVSERYFAQLQHVTSAKFKTSYDAQVYNLDQLDGKRIAYGKSTNGTSYYLPITFEFNNVGNVIAGSFVEVYLLGAPRSHVISLPKSALTEEQGLNFVYVKVDDHGFMRREVKLGTTDGERYEILKGIHPGEEVVVNGAIHVKLASASNSIPGHTHNH